MNGAFSHSNSLAPSVSDKLSSALTVFGFRLLRPLSSYFSLVSSARGLFSLSVPLSTSHPSHSQSVASFPELTEARKQRQDKQAGGRASERSGSSRSRQAARRSGSKQERESKRMADG